MIILLKVIGKKKYLEMLIQLYQSLLHKDTGSVNNYRRNKSRVGSFCIDQGCFGGML